MIHTITYLCIRFGIIFNKGPQISNSVLICNFFYNDNSVKFQFLNFYKEMSLEFKKKWINILSTKFLLNNKMNKENIFLKTGMQRG